MKPAHRLGFVVLLPVLGWVGGVSGYLGLLTAAAWRARRRGEGVTDVPADTQHRFVVLVPAHDEEQGISATLQSLADVDYPTSQYSVHVVADNCTDATADVARAHGVEVHERRELRAPGKGRALAWVLRRLEHLLLDHDAVVIIDADSLVSRNFLRVMDARLSHGDKVIQAHYAVRDVDDSWVIALRSAALAVRHYLRPLARTSLGGSAGLHGNGMTFTVDVMRVHRWTGHLTEDIEMEAELLLEGERVAFAPDAVVWAEMPAGLPEARSQNERWERGRLEVTKRYVPRLLRAAAAPGTRHRLRCADAAVDHLMPPLSVTATVAAATGLASGAMWTLSRTRLSKVSLLLSLGAVGVQAAYVASGLRMVGAPRSVWLALARTPVLVAWKVPLWARALTRTPGAWVRTARN